jgi:DNA mismatch repair protein MutL
VANRIAAGEVVERPASVVKELLENALDAGAASVRVEVEGGGRQLIRVIDDGCGMSHDDALLAFERHATSKLRSADDLLAIATLGFRGEALPSIASVARLVLETRTAEEEQGTRVEIAGGKLIGVKPTAHPTGTTVSIGDLFYCVPARRKFLKSDTTELGHIASVVTHYALAHPGKRIELRTPTQEILSAPPVETLAERVYQVFGRQALDELVDVPATTGPIRANITEAQLEAGDERLAMTVTGYISRPEVQRPNRNAIYIFINGRLVRDRLLLHALTEAYRNVQPPGVFPAALLFLELPPEEVDVNVHPSKIEVRFRHQQFVHDFTRDALRQALARARPIAAFPAAAVGASGGPSGPALSEPSQGAGAGTVAGDRQPAPFAGLGGMSRGLGTGAAVAPSDDFSLNSAPWRPEALRFGFPAEGPPPAGDEFAAQFRSASHKDEFEMPPTAANGDEIANLKPLGQVSASFIVAVNSAGLWIVDQHVAHERVLFEQHLQARRAGAVAGQRLLVPLVVELSPRQIVIAEQIAEELAANGFEVTPMGPRSVAIQAAPAPVSAPDVERLLREILDAVERENQAISIETLQAKIAASTACHAAIKVNTPLDPPRMEWLLAELAKTECPMSCPHGRPVVLRYSVREIEKAFKRT